MRVRFAPSPTGALHIGGARTALYNWLLARGQGGTFVLRIEDTDRERSTPENVEQILDAMGWLRLEFDEGPIFQSERAERHAEALAQLLSSGRAYHSMATAEDVKAYKQRFGADRGFPYDSTLLLEAKPMKGSKRVPILEIGPKGEASINLWCNTASAQLVVVDATITVLLGPPTRQQCEPERMQADQDLVEALQQVSSWQREGDLLVLEGERPLAIAGESLRIEDGGRLPRVKIARPEEDLAEARASAVPGKGWGSRMASTCLPFSASMVPGRVCMGTTRTSASLSPALSRMLPSE